VMLAAPGGVQGLVRRIWALAHGFWEPRSRGCAPRGEEKS
jgi:hypothetical protein